ncbi:MAG: hypothetical protein M3Y59_09170 [Myxococcota bacterium]|nr:hypothetical protein [Myxococcota bacterium]
MKPYALLLALLLSASAAQAAEDANAHLLAGARAFRAQGYQQSVVEFRVALTLGAGPQARWYLAAALQKTGRTDEALAEFLRAEQEAPSSRDAVLTWYEAVASHEARLYARADRLLSSIQRAGPKLQEQVRQLRTQLAPLLSAPATPGVLEWYLQRGRTREPAAVAALYLEEARGLSARATPDAGTPAVKGSMPQ